MTRLFMRRSQGWRWPTVVLLASLGVGVEASTPTQTGVATRASTSSSDSLAGYDFGRVVQTLSESIHPLESEMTQSFDVFIETVDEAEALMAQGQTRDAMDRALSAVDAVRASRARVLDPMWEGQAFLAEQIGEVRIRLAKAVEADGRAGSQQVDRRTEAMLDRLAARIPDETDPVRKRWLIAHYRTVRDIGRVREMAQRLSPDERKLWISVLSVLDEASLAHQQVLMGTEVLYAQFDSTGRRLQEYLKLLDTVEGADRLLGMVRGTEAAAGEMQQFSASMMELHRKLGGFHETVEDALEGSMSRLEARVDSIQPQAMDLAGDQGVSAGIVSTHIDEELGARIARVQGQP